MVLDTTFFCGCLYIAYQLLILVDSITVPSLFYLAGTACPRFFLAGFYNSQYLFKYLGILVT